MKDHVRARAVTQLVACALLWSLAGVLIKSADWPPLAVAGARGLIAGVFLAAVNARHLRFTWSPLQLGAAVAYAGCTILFLVATKLTTAANAILLQYTAPIWIALFGAWLLRERATRTDWLTIAAMLAGMGLFFSGDLRFTGLLGNLLAVLSGVFFAAMTMLLRKQKDGSPLESILLGNLLAFLVGLPAMVRAPAPSSTCLLMLGLLGVVQLGAAYQLYSRAIRHLPALQVVLITVLEPILNPTWVLLAIGERPGPRALVGGVIVLGASTFRSIAATRGRDDRPFRLARGGEAG
jgi:drug/metabolite transporter (DMT)-like permease